MVCSVTEGEDKPLKYPLMFRACELVLINKIDLLPHLDFDLERLLANLDAVNPGVERMLVSARTGEGVDAFRDWLAAVPGAGRGGGVSAGRSPRLDALIASASRPASGFFEPEAERIARLCHRMAERFARGGRLIALGRSPAARSDARHVAVEFVHPVIVGKRALPALALYARGRAARGAGRARGRAGATSSIALRAARTRRPRRRCGWRAARGCLTIAFAPGPMASRRPATPFVRQELAETALPRAVGARARVLRAPRAARGPRRRGRPRRRRVELPLPVPRRAGGRPRGGRSPTCARPCS